MSRQAVEDARDAFDKVYERRDPQTGRTRVFLTPLVATPDPLGNRYTDKLLLGYRDKNSVWTPLTLDPCGPQV